MLRIKSCAGHPRCTDLHALLMNNFEYRVLSIESTAVQWCVLVRVLNLHRDKNRRREPGRDGKILSDTGFYP